MRARLHPLGNGGYSVLFDGKLLVERSRDPECDAARTLLARGYNGAQLMLDGSLALPSISKGQQRWRKVRTVPDL